MSKALNILWLKSGALHPLDTGGKLRTYNMLHELSRTHRITYLSLCSPETPASSKELAEEYSHDQMWIPWSEAPKRSLRFAVDLARNHFASGNPYVIDKYHSPEMQDAIRHADRKRSFDLIVCDFLTPAVN